MRLCEALKLALSCLVEPEICGQYDGELGLQPEAGERGLIRHQAFWAEDLLAA